MKKLALLLIAGMMGCISEMATGPDPVPESIKPITETVQPTPVDTPVSTTWTKPTFEVRGDKIYVTITNPKQGPRYVGLACYLGQVHNIEGQTLGSANHWKVVKLGAGESIELGVALQCGHNQCDAFFDFATPPVPPWFGSKLIAATLLSHECTPPECTTCECRGDCPPPPCVKGKPECEELVWNQELCTWVGECRECEIPPDYNLTVDRPLGNPRSECAYFGDYVPGTPADFWVTKCGKFYEVTESKWLGPTCSNGKDVSHRTPCKCDGPN
jgi:hypothetical protein